MPTFENAGGLLLALVLLALVILAVTYWPRHRRGGRRWPPPCTCPFCIGERWEL